MTKKVTIYDIAKISGVSIKTVSRVINGGHQVKKSTYDKVMAVVHEQRFIPNVYARNLSNKATINILISIKKRESFPLLWVQTLLDKLFISCKAHGVNAIVEYFGDDEDVSNSILSASGSLIDGVIVFYESENDKRIEFLQYNNNNNNIPFIVFGKSRDNNTVYVSNDDKTALYELMSVLYETGQKNVWLLMGNHSMVTKERVEGAKKFIQDNQIDDLSVDVFYDLSTVEQMYDFLSQKLSKKHLPDAIFVSGDEKVQGLIRACHEKNIQIPDDVYVIGFDDIPISQYYTPALSTVSPNYTEMAQQIVQKLVNMIKGNEEQSIEIATTLVRRQSF